jgi:hypothetical protein
MNAQRAANCPFPTKGTAFIFSRLRAVDAAPAFQHRNFSAIRTVELGAQ